VATPGRWGARAAALAEVCGVYGGGLLVVGLLARLVLGFLGLTLPDPLRTLASDPQADLLVVARDLAVVLLLQYAGPLLLAVLIGRWHRRRPLAAYGLTTNGRSWTTLVATGLVLFAAGALPTRLVDVLGVVVPLGPRADFQEAVFARPWDLPFWVLVAVGSFGLVPVVEELFFRGYVQTRLTEDLGAPAAVVATALFFVLSHGQYYLQPSPRNALVLAASLVQALAWGYVFARTGSLVAPILAHALVNLPGVGGGGAAPTVLAGALGMLAVVVVARGPILRDLRAAWALLGPALPRPSTLAAAATLGAFAVLMAVAQELALLLGAALLVAVGIAEAIGHRGHRPARAAEARP
jgi:membrane protease YdiL (CAAX protease family)